METVLPPDFKDFLKLLNTHQVEYLLIGGHAVSYYGYPRATHDIDFWVAVTPTNAERLIAVLQAFGFTPAEISTAWFLKMPSIVRMGHPPMRIELTTSIAGVTFAECYARRVIANLDGLSVPIISLEDLKINKRAAGRAKDLADLENLP